MKTTREKSKSAPKKKEPDRLWVLSDEELGKVVGGAYLGIIGQLPEDGTTRCGKSTCLGTDDVTCP